RLLLLDVHHGPGAIVSNWAHLGVLTAWCLLLAVHHRTGSKVLADLARHGILAITLLRALSHFAHYMFRTLDLYLLFAIFDRISIVLH
ncbi:MAG: hypothetical protein ACYDHX_14265, partial [Methanothrix sp.]